MARLFGTQSYFPEEHSEVWPTIVSWKNPSSVTPSTSKPRKNGSLRSSSGNPEQVLAWISTLGKLRRKVQNEWKMLTRFKSAIYSVVNGYESGSVEKEITNGSSKPPTKFPYTRPKFLQLHSNDEMQVASDHSIRPIIVPRDITQIPWFTGYAEAVNAGKSAKNEDQAAIHEGFLERSTRVPSAQYAKEVTESTSSSDISEMAGQRLPYYYFALFDGHAGSGAAVAAANQLHYIIHEKLVDVIDHLLPPRELSVQPGKPVKMWIPDREMNVESFIVGALEAAFWEMDELIAEDKHRFKMTGGCTALVSLFILGKIFIANAGDCRAILSRDNIPYQVSTDFTPESERQRIRQLAACRPEFLGTDFTCLDYLRRPSKADLGQRMLYREPHMTGWAYKTITVDDLKFPVVYGEGKRSRVLATIGVTRGFGDHDLKAQVSGVFIKPFLTAQPEVRIVDLDREDVTDSDVLVLGTDGLWDVTSNETAVSVVQNSMEGFPTEDQSRYKYRFTSAAQDLVMNSRGKLTERSWRTASGKSATADDISVFVIPLLPYKLEHAQWRNRTSVEPKEAKEDMVLNSPPTEEVVVPDVAIAPATVEVGEVEVGVNGVVGESEVLER